MPTKHTKHTKRKGAKEKCRFTEPVNESEDPQPWFGLFFVRFVGHFICRFSDERMNTDYQGY